jgi:hypothetical protein
LSENEALHVGADATALAHEVITELGLTGTDAALVERIGRMIAERDRHVEDFLNTHVVRHARTFQTLGNGTPVNTVTWTDLTPTVEVQVSKAENFTSLRVECSVFADIGGFVVLPFWAAVGAIVLDTDGNTVLATTEIVRAAESYNVQASRNFSGVVLLTGIPAAVYKVRLQAKISVLGGGINAQLNDTMALTVTEVP